MSNNLNLSQVAAGQANPEVTTNTKGGEIDAALTETTSLSVSGGNVTVTGTQFTRSVRLFVTGASVGGRTVTLPATKRLLIIEADSTNTQSVAIVVGSTSISLSPGYSALFYTDGTANGLRTLGAIGTGSAAAPVDIGIFLPGIQSAGAEVFRYIVVRQSITLPASLTGSSVSARVAATSSNVFTIKKNGSSVGTMTIAASGTTATFSFSSSVTFAVGDLFTINAPGVADATLADIAINLTGTRP